MQVNAATDVLYVKCVKPETLLNACWCAECSVKCVRRKGEAVYRGHAAVVVRRAGK